MKYYRISARTLVKVYKFLRLCLCNDVVHRQNLFAAIKTPSKGVPKTYHCLGARLTAYTDAPVFQAGVVIIFQFIRPPGSSVNGREGLFFCLYRFTAPTKTTWNLRKPNTICNAVKCITITEAKGIRINYVFLRSTWLIENKIPLVKSINTKFHFVVFYIIFENQCIYRVFVLIYWFLYSF